MYRIVGRLGAITALSMALAVPVHATALHGTGGATILVLQDTHANVLFDNTIAKLHAECERLALAMVNFESIAPSNPAQLAPVHQANAVRVLSLYGVASRAQRWRHASWALRSHDVTGSTGYRGRSGVCPNRRDAYAT